MGAEHLLGHGDMLYLPPGTVSPRGFMVHLFPMMRCTKLSIELKKSGEPEYEFSLKWRPK